MTVFAPNSKDPTAWNYRIVECQTEKGSVFTVFEIYYDEDDNICGWNEDSIRSALTKDELREDIAQMMIAFSEPVLVFEDLEALVEEPTPKKTCITLMN